MVSLGHNQGVFFTKSKLLKAEFTEDLQNQTLTFSGIFRFINSKFMKTIYAP